MRPTSDEDLILFYYGEAVGQREIENRLASSDELRRRYAEISRVLDAVEELPEPIRPAAYASRVWHRIAPELEASKGGWRPRPWLRPGRQWGLAVVMILLMVTAFVAGRMMPRGDGHPVAGLPDEGRQRILLMTVAGHLERSEMLLLELVNTKENGDIDLSMERRLARELGQGSRLYRQAARQAGQSDMAAILEQLETVLVELSHGPETIPSSELGDLRVRLEEGEVLFKMRVLGSRLRREVEAAGPAAAELPDSARI